MKKKHRFCYIELWIFITSHELWAHSNMDEQIYGCFAFTLNSECDFKPSSVNLHSNMLDQNGAIQPQIVCLHKCVVI